MRRRFATPPPPSTFFADSSIPGAMALSGTPNASLAGRAYLDIRNRILKGELPVGMALSRRRLAEELGISVPPITEALQQLESEGLLESKPRVGTRVRVPTPEDVQGRSIVREALETQAARLFVQRATAAEKNAMVRMGRRVDHFYAKCERVGANREALFSANSFHLQLHLRIAECARCSPLRDAIEKEQVLVFNWLFDTAVGRRGLGADYHARLTAVLASGSPSQAAAAMRRHIHRGLEQVLSKLSAAEETGAIWRLGRRRSASASHADDLSMSAKPPSGSDPSHQPTPLCLPTNL